MVQKGGIAKALVDSGEMRIGAGISGLVGCSGGSGSYDMHGMALRSLARRCVVCARSLAG